ncbi:MAG: CrcB family protein [Planctomycetia bacterium]|nr:CrcB family protein [Planctomycetia bacterium]
MIAHYALLALAGALGTLLRAGCTTVAIHWFGAGFPAGTIAVNVLGSFAFGAVMGASRVTGLPPTGLETIVLVGLLGGFTTYSSFAFQSFELLETGRPLAAVVFILGTNVLAIAAAWAGLRLCGGAA